MRRKLRVFIKINYYQSVKLVFYFLKKKHFEGISPFQSLGVVFVSRTGLHPVLDI
jgi:hypothetical protein